MKKYRVYGVIAAAAAILCSCSADKGGSTGSTNSVKETTTTTAAAQSAAETEAPAETTAVSSEEVPDDSSQEEKPAETTPDEDITAIDTESSDTIWALKDMDAEKYLPECSVKEAEGDEGQTLKLASAKICEPKDDVIKSLKENKWLKDLGVETDIIREIGQASKNNASSSGWSYSYEEGLCFSADPEKPVELSINDKFSLRYGYDTRNNDGERYIQINIKNMDMTDKEVQENVFAVVKEICGDELGEFVLFTKDPDPERYAKNPNNIHIDKSQNGVGLIVTRSLNETSMHILIDVTPDNSKQNSGGYTGGHEPDFTKIKGMPNAVFGGNIGVDEFNSENFADEYRKVCGFKDDDAFNASYDITAYIGENGFEFDTAEVKFDKTIDCSIWLNYSAGFKDEDLDTAGIKTGITQCVDHSRSKEDNLAMINKSMSAFFGTDVDVKMSDLNDKGRGEVKIPLGMKGNDGDTKVTVDCDGMLYWKIGK